jgi:hypothetical protein
MQIPMLKLFNPPSVTHGYVHYNALTKIDIEEMHALFSEYYDNAEYEIFTKDLADKDGSLICRDSKNGRIIAFCNLKITKVRYKKKTAYALFTGDTVCHRKYWKKNNGRNPLHSAFFFFIIKFWLLHPFSRTFWFLISMSYRTYLLIANNIADHYPNYQLDNPKTKELKDICHLFAKTMFGDKFDADTGLIDFGYGQNNQVIKQNVAPVTDDMLQRYPKIAYYHKLNPNAGKGIELACIGEVNITAITSYMFKFIRLFFKSFFNPKQNTAVNEK